MFQAAGIDVKEPTFEIKQLKMQIDHYRDQLKQLTKENLELKQANQQLHDQQNKPS